MDTQSQRPHPPPPPTSAAPPSTISDELLGEVYEGEMGRFFQKYQRKDEKYGGYIYAMDDNAMNALDIFHQFFLHALKQKLHTVELPRNNGGRSVLDIGCGTGIWLIDMADELYNSNPDGGDTVIGVDLASLLPVSIPSNIKAHKLDIEKSWGPFQENSFDLIHARLMGGAIRGWPALYKRIYDHCKPGGQFEQIDFDWQPRCDDETLRPTSALHEWAKEFMKAMDEAGRPVRCDPGATKSALEAAGFTVPEPVVIEVPCNGWHDDFRRKELGRWFCMSFFESVAGMSTAPFCRILGWKEDRVVDLIDKVKQDVSLRANHGYFRMYIWTAKKPGASS